MSEQWQAFLYFKGIEIAIAVSSIGAVVLLLHLGSIVLPWCDRHLWHPIARRIPYALREAIPFVPAILLFVAVLYAWIWVNWDAAGKAVDYPGGYKAYWNDCSFEDDECVQRAIDRLQEQGE